ncbi:flagellar basal body rod C-terminal domain-containing protein [Phenylobacterium sp.]|uniref:flagellar basal body rod C-terminal domain-containing protein n=1 Tax=Phenylobacterium sp. TaxID=1871053 RepID=UPI0030F46126
MNPIATAQYGLFAASQRFEASAQRTAQMGDPAFDVDYTHEAIEQITAKTEFRANLAVIKTADQMTDSLLDILA